MKLDKQIVILFFLIVSFTYVVSHGNHKNSKGGHKHVHGHSSHSGHNHNHHHHHEHNHSHNHAEKNLQSQFSNYINHYNNVIFNYLYSKLESFSKEQQAYIGALITSSAPYPIFVLILLFNIKNIKLLDIMSCFASGALLGDVLLHNLPEILTEGHSQEKKGLSFIEEFLLEKETLICLGVIVLFVIEKIISLSLIEKNKVDHFDNSEAQSHHGHSHGNTGSFSNSTQNIIISVIGDCVHNITDGLAIGAAYSKSLIFFKLE
jgi:zinc transporter ZupT